MPLILPKSATYEFEEKRSKFIAHCAPVQTKDEALTFIGEIRNQYKDANHNVFAYYVTEGNVIRFSDDGEPSGTAGMPVLNVFQKNDIINFVCVVTRYFGGTLLGAGGLVRAYTRAAKGAMEAAEPEKLIILTRYRVRCSYPQLDKLKYNFDKWGIEVIEWIYTEQAAAIVQVREDQAEAFLDSRYYEYEIML